MGLKFTSLDCVPIRLNALVMPNVFGRSDVVQESIQKHYMSNLTANGMRILGSSNLLGDPVSFVNTLGTGVDEFFIAPKNV